MSSNSHPKMLYRSDKIPGTQPVRSKPGKFWAIAQDEAEEKAMLENGFFEGVYGDGSKPAAKPEKSGEAGSVGTASTGAPAAPGKPEKAAKGSKPAAKKGK